MSIEKVFMNELLADSIIKLLPLRDVKNAVLVCRLWRERVECRQYWRSATLRIRDETILSSPRIQSVRRFKVDSSELVNLFFSFISDHDDYDVEYLRCDSLSLTTVPTQLASSICKINEVELCEIELTKRQSFYLFKAIGQSSDLKLKKLVLCDLLLDRVDPKTLALAVTKVEEIILVRVELLNTYEAIFRAISQSEPKLKKLTIKMDDYIMDWVRDIDSMAHALCKVQTVELHTFRCELMTNLLEAMFTNIATSIDLKLQNLEISFYGARADVSGVSPDVLASAVCRLKRCNLFSLGMASQQVEELCKEIVNCKNLQLSSLNIGNNMAYLQDVEEDVLASAVVRLEVVEMYFDYYSSDAQLQAILNKVVEFPDLKLKELYVDYIDEEDSETRSLLMKVKDKIKIYWSKILVPS